MKPISGAGAVNNMNTQRTLIILLLFIAIYFVHCDLSVNDDPPDEQQGWFTFDITGAFTESISGAAIYGQYLHPETGERGLVLHFVSITPAAQLNGKLNVLETGVVYDIIQFEDEDTDFMTYTDDGEFIGAFFNHVQADYSDRFYSRTGDVYFEEFDDDILKGWFSFIATGYYEEEPEDTVELFLSGNFEAIDGEIEID